MNSFAIGKRGSSVPHITRNGTFSAPVAALALAQRMRLTRKLYTALEIFESTLGAQ